MHSKKKVALAAAAVLSGAALAGTTLTGTANAVAPQALSHQCLILASAANIRSSANTHSVIMGIGYRGQYCTWSSRKTGTDGYQWYHVRMNRSHVTGWIRRDLLDAD